MQNLINGVNDVNVPIKNYAVAGEKMFIFFHISEINIERKAEDQIEIEIIRDS